MHQTAKKTIFFICVLIFCLPGISAAGDFTVDNDTLTPQNGPDFSSCDITNGSPANPYCPIWDGEHTQPDPYLVYELRKKIVTARLETQGITLQQGDYGILSLPPPQNEFPTSGIVRIPVFLVDFSDAPHDPSQTVADVQSKMFGDGNGGYPYESLRNYYHRSSYNQLTVTGDVYGWYRAGQPRSYYMNLGKTEGRKALINEILLAYNSQINFANYDANGNGKIDALFIKWAGSDTGWGTFWWASMSGVSSPVTVDGVTPWYFVWSWYSNPSGGPYSPLVDMHETGHILGLPDYYDYNDSVGPKGGLGGWDMMDHNWGDHNAFSKYLLGWIDPMVISSGTHQVLLPPSGTTASDNTVLIMPNIGPDSFGEFFLVQYREPGTGNDPLTNGLNKAVWIWHVDSTLAGGDFKYDNSVTDHKLLRLMEADGQEQIETGNGNWDVNDFYLPGKVLGPATVPDSSTYAGSNTNVSVANMQHLGSSMQVDFSILSDVPVAGFSANVTSGIAPLTVTFTDSSTGTGLSAWKWDFMNDGAVDNTTRNPTYTYTTAGTYTVNLTVTGTAGTDSEIKAGYISVSAPAAPCAAFTVNTTSGTVPLAVKFTDTSSNHPTAWNWSFRNVTAGNTTVVWFSTVQSPTHIFGVGTYSVILNASNSEGYNLSSQTTFINVIPNVTSKIGIFRPGSGIWSLDSNGNNAWEPSDASLSWGLPNDVPVIGDWNGDSKDSIGIFRPSSGIWSLDTNENLAWEPSDVSLSWGLPNDVPVIGDWNGDSKDSIGIFRPGSGIWSLDTNENLAWEPSDVSLSWGLPNDVPVIGDWNGDTKDSIGIFRPGSGIWSLDSNENFAWAPSDVSLSWGLPGDIPVIGNWNGDGRDAIGIFRPSSGIWSLDSNGNNAWEGSDTSLSWGLPGDIPVIGDWNGDGRDAIGIFRPGSGIWSLDMNENFAWEPTDKSLSWGLPNDKPAVGNY